MLSPKLRRVFALTALFSALSLLPAQAAGFAPRELRRVSLSERFECWGASAWSFLAGVFDKATHAWDPNGRPSEISASFDDGGY